MLHNAVPTSTSLLFRFIRPAPDVTVTQRFASPELLNAVPIAVVLLPAQRRLLPSAQFRTYEGTPDAAQHAARAPGEVLA